MSDAPGAGQSLGTAYADIEFNLSRFGSQLNSTFDAAERTVTQRMQGVANQMERVGGQMTLAFAPVTAFMGASVRSFVNFDDVMREIAARTGSTDEEMEAMRRTALQMGRDTAFSATDSAQAMLELSSSGYNLNQTMTALVPTLNLAAAGNMALGESADAVTDILAQYQLAADQAGRVTDALAAASQSSSADVRDLVQAFSNVGPVAANVNLSIEDTAAILAVFSENGIKGAEAGTQLRSMLNHLYGGSRETRNALAALGVSLTDTQGNFRPLNDVIEEFNQAMNESRTVTVRVNNLTGEQQARMEEAQDAYARASRQQMLYNDGLTEGALTEESRNRGLERNSAIMRNAEQVIGELAGTQENARQITMELTRSEEQNFRTIKALAGTYGQTGLLALLAADGFDTMLETMEGATSASEVARAKMEGVGGMLRMLRSSITTLGIVIIGKLAPYLEEIGNHFMGVVNAITTLIDKNEQLGTAIAVLLSVVSLIGPAFLIGAKIISLVVMLIGGLTAAIGFLLSPIGLAIAAVVALYIAYKKNFLGIADAVQPVLNAIEKAVKGVVSVFRLLLDGKNVFDALRLGLGFFVDDIARAMGIGEEQARGMQNAFMDAVRSIQKTIQPVRNALSLLFKGVSVTFELIRDGMNVFDALQHEGLGQFIDNIARAMGMGEERAKQLQRVFFDVIEGIRGAFNGARAIIEGVVSYVVGAVQRLRDAFSGGGTEGLMAQVEVEFTNGLQRIQTLIEAHGPAIMAAFLRMLLGLSEAVRAVAGPVMAALGSLLSAIGSWIVENAPIIWGYLDRWAQAFTMWVIEKAIPWLLEKLGELASAVWGWIQEQAPVVAAKLAVWASAFGDWVTTTAIPWLRIKLEQLASDLWAWIQEKTPLIEAQLQPWADKFSDWVTTTTLPQLRAKLGQLWTEVSTWIQAQAPLVAAQLQAWANEFSQWVTTTALPQLRAKLGQLWTEVSTWIQAQVPIIKEKLQAWAESFSEWVLSGGVTRLLNRLDSAWLFVMGWIGQKAGELIPLMMDWATNFGQWATNALVPLITKLTMLWVGVTLWIGQKALELPMLLLSWAIALYSWIETALPQVMIVLGSFFGQIAAWVTGKAATLGILLLTWTVKLAGWIVDAIPLMQAAFAEVWGNLVEWIGGWAEAIVIEFVAVGSGIVQGLRKGIEDNWEDFANWFKGQASSIIQDALSLFGIGSPSKVFADIGKWIPEGLRVGIEDGMGAPLAAMANLANAMQTPMSAMQGAQFGGGGAGAMVPAMAGTQNHYSITFQVMVPQDIGMASPEQVRTNAGIMAETLAEKFDRLVRQGS